MPKLSAGLLMFRRYNSELQVFLVHPGDDLPDLRRRHHLAPDPRGGVDPFVRRVRVQPRDHRVHHQRARRGRLSFLLLRRSMGESKSRAAITGAAAASKLKGIRCEST